MTVPGMALRHQRVDKFYREKGAFNKKPGLFSEGSTGLQELGEADKGQEKSQPAQQPGE